MTANSLVVAPIRALHAVLKRWGASTTKQKIWDSEYESGKWRDIDPSDSITVERDLVYAVLEKYASGGDLLDLGCGTGSTAVQIADVYRSYLGIDISSVAIESARNYIQIEASKAAKTRFATADIECFMSDQKYDVVLYRECLYYFSLPQIKALLDRHAQLLHERGVFVVRLHDRNRYAKIVSHITDTFETVEQVAPDGDATIVLVFRPRANPSPDTNIGSFREAVI